MLKFIGVRDVKQEVLEASGYTLTVRWNNIQPMHHVFWRTGNFHDALVEVGLSDTDHSIEEVTIVTVHERYLVANEILDFRNLQIPRITGLPICEWTWDQPSPRVIDERQDFSLHIGETDLSLYFGENIGLNEIVIADRVSFGIDSEKRVRAVKITRLEESELANIKLAFPSNK